MSEEQIETERSPVNISGRVGEYHSNVGKVGHQQSILTTLAKRDTGEAFWKMSKVLCTRTLLLHFNHSPEEAK